MSNATPSVPQTLGHPSGLFYLFFAELWERFSFYGMRALLTLYLGSEIYADLANGKDIAYEIYAAYGALVYFTPVLGGMIADRIIGHRNSIMLGAVLMCLGHFAMAFQNEMAFFGALGLLIVGNGFFKPNISSMVGGLYEQGDARRDGGFTIFYMGINVGAFLAPLVCGWLGMPEDQGGLGLGWHYGFGAAGVGMLAGLIVFWRGMKTNVYGDQGFQPLTQQSNNLGSLNIRYIVYALAFLSVPLFAFLVKQNSFIVIPSMEMGLMSFLLFLLLALVLIFMIVISFQHSKQEVGRIWSIAILSFFITVFWAFFEQAGSSLTYFAQENVNLVFLNAAQTNAINPGYIMLLAIPFSFVWTKLHKTGKNPGTPVKFALGIAQLGLGFMVFAMSAKYMDESGRVPMFFLMLGYLFITTGELFLSPIGLSKVTELSPAKLVAFFMGVWFLSSSFAHYIAGIIAKLTTKGSEVAEVTDPGFMHKAITWMTGFENGITTSAVEGVQGLAIYTGVFAQIAVVSFAVALFALLISPLLKKMMGGIH